MTTAGETVVVEVHLPHQCDYWEIGNYTALRSFIAQAEAVAHWMEQNGLRPPAGGSNTELSTADEPKES